jgi:ectoine hydroxylase-related dioxygenase (phytanoyl-CoA dioxygenase family)
MPKRWGAFHVTFPMSDREWSVAPRVWHADFPFDLPTVPLPGVKMFVFLSDVPPRGGGTLVVAGSHRLAGRLAANTSPAQRADTRRMRLRLLDSDPWLRTLTTPGGDADRTRRLMDDGATIDDVRVQVVELSGRAGEIVLTHPWLLHCRSLNCGNAPRLMRSTDIYRRELHPIVFRTAEKDAT